MKVPKKLGFLGLLIVAVGFAQSARAAMMNFEDLSLGTTYHVTESFNSAGVVVVAQPFELPDHTLYDGGEATVENTGRANGAGNEIHANNINLSFNFGIALDGLALQYGEYGGNLNININHSFLNFSNFHDIHNTTIGGVLVFTLDTGIAGESSGAMFLMGNIGTFVIGGQQLWIDNVVASPVPEPATILLFGLGGIIMLVRNKTRT
jgi:hypothetical protein